jgi:hypothetical protein
MKKTTCFCRTMLPIALLAIAWHPAQAVTVTESTSAPTDFVIGQSDFSGALDGGQDYSNNGGPPGQIFTTDQAFTLADVTVKGSGGSGNDGPGTSYTIVISSVSGTTLTHLDSETTVFDPGVNDANYITFSLSTPVALVADTQYSFSIYSDDGSFLGLGKSSTDVLAGGYAFEEGSSPDTTADGDQIVNAQNGTSGEPNDDRTFYLTTVPEPSTWAMLAGGLVLLAVWHRRRLKAAI